ncbi:MAG: hypothetical protein IAE89_12665 [Anaerolineae bacterium]|nr:hypothetical protein [Anaerolineae bacterium]
MRQLKTGTVLLLLLALFSLNTLALSAQSESIPSDTWLSLDLALLDDDNSGAAFAISQWDGLPALEITPSGSSEETKLAYPVSGSELQAWIESESIQIALFLPETNTLNPNNFFLGLADVTASWRWVGGLFGVSDGDTGVVNVNFQIETAVQEINPAAEYRLYLSFFNQSSGSKSPLSEPFFITAINRITAETRPVAEPPDQEVSALLAMEDPALLNAVARQTFAYFWDQAHPQTGLVKDRSTPASVSSIAATGFGLAAIPVAVDRGWITESEGYDRAHLTLETFLSGGVQGERGFFYHFVNPETGERVWNSELSSIDTALLVAGALVAGQYFEDTDVQAMANQLYENVEWDWMRGRGEMLHMGWTPESEFLNATWDHFDESMLLYALAIGSPTHPVPASTWDLWRRPLSISGGYIYLPGEPLFVYQYPQAFLNLRGLEDAYANYWNNTARACDRNHQFAVHNSGYFLTYQNGVWGLSASDGPFGYRAYGASEVNHDGTIAPYAAVACVPFTPEISLSGIRALLANYGSRVWREYGFVSALNENENWYSREHIGIDQGDILLMIANYQDGFVWDLFMANPHIQNALNAMGFVESVGDYAITPAYLAEVTGG